MPVVATITYAGSQIGADVITTSPWSVHGITFPEHGSPAWLPQFHLDVLQTSNIDGARYRIGGSHFPAFACKTIVPAYDYSEADNIARQMEAIRGDVVKMYFLGYEYRLQVLECVAKPNAARVVGASAGNPSFGGGAVSAASWASVDTDWKFQYTLA